MQSESADEPKPYSGKLTSEQAASAMQAARLNAVELLKTSEILFDLKQFAHSVVFSMLAIEEAGKLHILLNMLLKSDSQKFVDWKPYRQHRAKTEMLNSGIRARVRAVFPDISLDQAKEIAANGPTPNELETAKQRSIYSDCLTVSGRFVCHLPSNVDWAQQAWERLCEAQAIVSGLRDRTPEELEIWLKHATHARSLGKGLADVIPDIGRELSEKGLVKKGSWDTLLKDIEAENEGGSKGRTDEL